MDPGQTSHVSRGSTERKPGRHGTERRAAEAGREDAERRRWMMERCDA